jgi:hypothetical protein
MTTVETSNEKSFTELINDVQSLNIGKSNSEIPKRISLNYFQWIEYLLKGSSYIHVGERKYLKTLVDYYVDERNKSDFKEVYNKTPHISASTRKSLLELITANRANILLPEDPSTPTTVSELFFRLDDMASKSLVKWLRENDYVARSCKTDPYYISGRDEPAKFEKKKQAFITGLTEDITIIYRTTKRFDSSSFPSSDLEEGDNHIQSRECPVSR